MRMSKALPTAREIRQALVDHGFTPIPVNGKVPPFKSWQKVENVSPSMLEAWGKNFPSATNTGMLARYAPGLDDDITIPDAAESIEALAREHFEERGDIHVRFGRPPKRLIPLRTDEPFSKLSRVFVAPDGTEQKIEILGDGQQYVVDGIHPDTHKPYGWHGGDLATIKREDLPYVRREDMEQFLAAATKLLTEEFGFVLRAATNGGEPHEAGTEPQASPDLIAAALAVIPNNADWDQWNAVGMAVWRATSGSGAGLAAFDAWSKTSPKYDARVTAEKWAAYFKSPPTQIGAGTIFHLADQASPAWRQEYEARKDNGKTSTDGKHGPGETELPFVDMAQWDNEEVPMRQWSVLDRLPLRQPALFSGEGATGKTIIELQLCAAHVLGRDWLGSMPELGPAIYLGCEDEVDELHRRLADIATHYGVRFEDMINGGLHLICLAGKNALLGVPDRNGQIIATPLFEQLLKAAEFIKPKHIGIDTSADVYGGSEIDRGQVRQFLGLLRRLAIVADGTVNLLAHPSLQGISSGSGLSGSTGWHNSVRARMYLCSPQGDKDEQPDSDLRELQFLKNNYGRLAERIVLRYRDGVFLAEPGMSAIDLEARERDIDEMFLAVLYKLIASKRPVSPSPQANNYAPTAIARHSDGKGHSGKDYQAAMARLLDAGKIHIAVSGPPSKQVRFLALGKGDD
jgi:RecA-family ATPase